MGLRSRLGLMCIHPGCSREDLKTIDYCSAHYQRLRAGKDMDNPPVRPFETRAQRGRHFCVGDEGRCGRPVDSNGLCGGHVARRNRGLSVDSPLRYMKAKDGTGTIEKAGYRIISVNGKAKKEHRHVMEQILGRPLLRSEEVHHRNGMRADNRPENLELWSTSQPPGQRVEDKTAWAIEWLRVYAPERLVSRVV